MVRPLGAPTAAQQRRIETAIRRLETGVDKEHQRFHQTLRDLHHEGVSIRQLAEHTGRSTNTIQRWLKTETEEN